MCVIVVVIRIYMSWTKNNSKVDAENRKKFLIIKIGMLFTKSITNENKYELNNKHNQ